MNTIKALLHSSETAIVLACSRNVSDPQRAHLLNGALQQDIDWHYLVRLAQRQGVLPLVYRNLRTTALSAVPGTSLALQVLFERNRERNSSLWKALSEIIGLLEQSEIRAIPYKGLLLALAVYGGLELRKSGDIDILVHPNDYRRSRKILLAHGYRMLPLSDVGYECAMRTPDGKVEVDLHQSLLPPCFDVGFYFDELWERCGSVSFSGKTIPNLSAEDLLMVLCTYVMKDTAHKQVRLFQVCDIAELISTHHVDWPKLLERNSHELARHALRLGLRVTDKIYEIRFPDDIREWIAQDQRIDSLSDRVIDEIFRDSEARHHLFFYLINEHKFIVTLYQGGWDKARTIVLGVFRLIWSCTIALICPTDEERTLLRLPASLGFLYYVIRPFRLSFRYFIGKPIGYLRAMGGKSRIGTSLK